MNRIEYYANLVRKYGGFTVPLTGRLSERELEAINYELKGDRSRLWEQLYLEYQNG